MEDYCQYDPWNTAFIQELAKKPSIFTIWMIFLDRTEILLNTIHATRAGNWVVLLESYHDMIPFTRLHYDHLNYAKHLTTMLTEFTKLEEIHPAA